MDKSILNELVDFIQKTNYWKVSYRTSKVVQIEKREKKQFNTRKLLRKQS